MIAHLYTIARMNLILQIFTLHILSRVLLSRESSIFHRQMISSQMITISSNQTKVGYLSSPNYPHPYPVNSSSAVTLIVNDDSTLNTMRLTFEDLEIHSTNHCESEAIEVFSVEDDTETITKRAILIICGTSLPKPLVVEGKEIVIQFTSDAFSLGKSRGFMIKFEFLDRNELPDGCPRGQFQCRNRGCIPMRLTCNRVDDCGDASDEDFYTPCSILPTIPYSINYTCGLLDIFNTAQTRRPSEGDGNERELSNLLKNRIVGGSRTERENGWPFQVSIQMMKIETISHVCGGTLIHPMFVVSAAHCFKGLIPTTEYKFLFGTKDLRQEAQPEPGNNVQLRYATSINLYPGGIMMPELEQLGLRQVDIMNDIALIELNAPVKLTPHVWPACLPHLSEPIFAGRECLASGFGDTRGTGHAFALKQVKQVIHQASGCQSMSGDMLVDDHTMICVRNQLAYGSCNGDSGGPLFCPEREIDLVKVEPSRKQPGDLIKYLPITSDDETSSESEPSEDDTFSSVERIRYTIYGVTSFTTDGTMGGGFCGIERVPTIYARISTKVEWILSQMKLSLFRMSKEDRQQDQNIRNSFFGYMFRSGVSRHPNYTQAMTIYHE